MSRQQKTTDEVGLPPPAAGDRARGDISAQRKKRRRSPYRILYPCLLVTSMLLFGVEYLTGDQILYLASARWYFWMGEGACQLHHGWHVPGWGLRPSAPHLRGFVITYGPLPLLIILADALFHTWRAVRSGWTYHLRRQRAQSGLCPNCGYNLTGNTSGVCPECGTSFRRLKDLLPELSTTVEEGLQRAGRADLTNQIGEVELERYTYDPGADAALLYLRSPRPLNFVETSLIGVRHGETIDVGGDVFVDIDNFGRLRWIEVLGASRLASMLAERFPMASASEPPARR